MRIEDLRGECERNGELDAVMDAFFDTLAEFTKKEEQKQTVWCLIPEQVDVMRKSLVVLKGFLADQDVKIVSKVFDERSHLGTITITSKKVVIFDDPHMLACIAGVGVGIDINANLDGTVEIVFGFRTADKITERV